MNQIKQYVWLFGVWHETRLLLRLLRAHFHWSWSFHEPNKNQLLGPSFIIMVNIWQIISFLNRCEIINLGFAQNQNNDQQIIDLFWTEYENIMQKSGKTKFHLPGSTEFWWSSSRFYSIPRRSNISHNQPNSFWTQFYPLHYVVWVEKLIR